MLAEERRQHLSGIRDWREIPGTIEYNVEATRRLRVGFIGCGGHSYRNIFPTFRYAPIDLYAVADINLERAEGYRRVFGAERAYDDYRVMLEREALDAVFIVTNYDEHGKPRYPAIATDAMRAGANAWIEKPPASSTAELEAMMAVERETGRFVQVGYKKMFTPAYTRAREIIESDEFGGLRQLIVRYAQRMPAPQGRFDLTGDPGAIGFLDHVGHPLGILQALGGNPTSMVYLWEETNGGFTTIFTMPNGGIATWLSPTGQGRSAPNERVEAIGTRAHLVVDNSVRLTYYRPRPAFVYGRSSSFLDDVDSAPVVWEPEFSLGNLYNDNHFFLGYVPEVRDFCQHVLDGTRPTRANLQDAWMQTHIYERYREPAGTVISFDSPPEI